MKAKEERNVWKVEVKTGNAMAMELSDDVLDQVVGGLAGIRYSDEALTANPEILRSSESIYRDSDVAKEMETITKNNILEQTQQAMQTQANKVSQGVLTLLQ